MSVVSKLKEDVRRHPYVYLMIVPVVAYYVCFHYLPMVGVVLAFKDFSPGLGIWKSPWVGLENFQSFFSSYLASRVIRNTLFLSLYSLVFGFPAPIILALLINEVRHTVFKRTVQTISYMPHFISIVVICGIIIDFTSSAGVINQLLGFFGIKPSTYLMRPELFRTVFVSSNIWQNIGWGSIIYLAAISAVDPGLYEASIIDGAGRFKQMLHITLPTLLPTITVLFIMRVGHIMSVGFEKVLLLYNPMTYENADIISTFVYRRGLLNADYGFSTAVGLFNSVVNFILLVSANWLSKKTSEHSLW